MQRSDVHVPANVPDHAVDTYIDNFLTFTKGTGRAFMFAGDQKIEHLNTDYVGDGVAADDADPEHLFRIASQAPVGGFASQHGLISRYARDYPDVPYIVKINSKTNLAGGDPLSTSLVDLDDVLALREAGVKVIGIGYTIYVGSQHEHIMFAEAGRLAARAHEHGLLVIFWMYPRGTGVPDERSPDIIGGVAGVGTCLGADFLKVAPPMVDGQHDPGMLTDAVKAAGRTGIMLSGGHAVDAGPFLHLTWQHIHEAGCRGSAVGRNVHQRPLDEAIRFAQAMASIVFHGSSTHDAYLISTGEKAYEH